MEQLLSVHHRFKVDIMSCFQKFYWKSLKSLSQSVRVLAAMIQSDVCTVHGKNLAKISKDAGTDPLAISRKDLIRKLDKQRMAPEGEE